MLKYNNTHIVTGYIKQLLATFNLPKFRIYTKEHQKYHDEAVAKGLARTESPEIIETVKRSNDEIEIGNSTFNIFKDHLYYANYIRYGKVQRYICTYSDSGEFIEGHWEDTKYHFHYNKATLNTTRNLNLKSMIYDSYTHEYLGDFLRFLRDYNDINLMPLYNCFSDTICTNLNIKFSHIYWDELEAKNKSMPISFTTEDTKYKIYMLPVKLFKSYTIAIDSDLPVEICCGFFGKYQDTRIKVQSLPGLTYKKYSNLSFNNPILYDMLSPKNLTPTETKYAEMAQIESTLKMFIKLPVNNNSSIVVLEGDYSGYNQNTFNKNWIADDTGALSIDTTSPITNKQNKFITNWDTEAYNDKTLVTTSFPEVGDRDFNPITKLQLLEMNTKMQHPFADRLVEYLTGSTIDSLDENIDNVKRVQKVMMENNLSFSTYGAWEGKMKNIIYEYMNTKHPDNSVAGITSLANHDCLGYVDKDVEKYYTSWGLTDAVDRYGNKKRDINGNYIKEKTPLNTILGIDLYDGLYDEED